MEHGEEKGRRWRAGRFVEEGREGRFGGEEVEVCDKKKVRATEKDTSVAVTIITRKQNSTAIYTYPSPYSPTPLFLFFHKLDEYASQNQRLTLFHFPRKTRSVVSLGFASHARDKEGQFYPAPKSWSNHGTPSTYVHAHSLARLPHNNTSGGNSELHHA